MNSALRLLLVSATVAAPLVSACGKDDVERTPISIRVRGPNDSVASEIYGFPTVSTDIEKVRVTAFSGFSVVERVEFEYGDPYTGTLPTLAYGPDNWVAVEALDEDDNVLASGATQWFTLRAGDTLAGALSVFTARPNRFTGAFRYDGDTDQSVASAFELPGGRAGAATVAMPDGRVVVIGGAAMGITEGAIELGTALDSIQVYDPADGTWYTVTEPGCDFSDGIEACATRTPSAASFSAAAVLDADTIIVSGGLTPDADFPDVLLASDDVFTIDFESPYEATVSAVNVESGAGAARAMHTATVMDDGRVLFIGGITGQYSAPRYLNTVDMVTNDGLLVYRDAGVTLNSARALHTAVNFREGSHGIIVTGGRTEDAVVGLSEVVYLNSDGSMGVDSFGAVAGSVDLSVPRFGHATAVYGCPGSDARYLLVAGGFTAVGTLALEGTAASTAIDAYIPGAFAADGAYAYESRAGLELADARAFASALSFLGSGDVVVAGGIGATGNVIETAERFVNPWGAGCATFGEDGDSVIRQEIADGLVTGRAFAGAVTLPSQFGLIAAGSSGDDGLTSSEFFNSNDYGLIFSAN